MSYTIGIGVEWRGQRSVLSRIIDHEELLGECATKSMTNPSVCEFPETMWE